MSRTPRQRPVPADRADRSSADALRPAAGAPAPATGAPTPATGSSPPRQPAVDAPSRRARLLEAAIELFSELPYDEVSVEDIAARAGVATGLLYYHFTDKQGLYAEGLQGLALQLKAAIEAAVDETAPPWEQTLAALRAHLSFVSEHATGYAELLRGAAAQPKVAAIVEEQRGQRLAAMIAGLPAEVAPTPLIRTTLEAWLHFVDGVQLAWLREGELTLEQVVQLCARTLFASVTSAIGLEQEQQAAQAQAPREPQPRRNAAEPVLHAEDRPT